MTTTHENHGNLHSPKLYMTVELGKSKWDVGFATGIAQNPRRVRIDATSRSLNRDGQETLWPGRRRVRH